MLVAKSFLSAFIIAGSATVVAANGVGPAVDYVRDLGVSAIRQSAELHRRKLQTTQTPDLSNMNPEMLCGFLPMAKAAMAVEMLEEGVSCPVFDCNDAKTKLELSCEIPKEICEDDHCQKDTKVDMSIDLILNGPASITTKQCMTFTQPADFAALGQSCWDSVMTIDVMGIVKAIVAGASSGMDEDDMTKAALKNMSLDSCTGGFPDAPGGAIACTCAACMDGDDVGITVTCDNGHHTSQCQEIDTFDVFSENKSVMKLQAADESAAAGTTFKVGVASLVLAFIYA
jgi:hypothetical protein